MKQLSKARYICINLVVFALATGRLALLNRIMEQYKEYNLLSLEINLC